MSPRPVKSTIGAPRALAAAAVCGLLAAGAAGQARSANELRDISRNISSPGTNSSVSNFRRYSYGLRGGRSGSRSRSVLRSSMSPRGQGTQIRRTTGRRQRNSMDLLNESVTDRRLGTVGDPIIANVEQFAVDSARSLQSVNEQPTFFTSAETYLEEISQGPANMLENRTDPVTSLVPPEPGLRRIYMQEGEKALDEGRYGDAISKFGLANDLVGDDPESLLNLAHAHFGADPGHASAAFYLRRVLKVFPELPATPIRPEAILSFPGHYESRMIALRQRYERTRVDADACLLLAYFEWYAGNVPEARAALRRAWRIAPAHQREKLRDAAETFWEGMVTTGKVPDEPLLPEAATQPAEDEAEAG